jgi:putative salt-induced outer membrane protein
VTTAAKIFLTLPLWALATTVSAQTAEQAPAVESDASALAPPVRAMIDAAIATGDKGKVTTVVALAKQTNPDATAEIDKLHRVFLDQQAEIAASKAAEKEAAIRSASFLKRWKGKGELGASRATGANDDLGLAVALSLNREGIDWNHKLRAQADYQRTNGTTSRERYFASYEPQYKMHDGLFIYALTQFESDRIQGYDERYTLSAGLGYKLINKEGFNLSLKGGPTVRYTQYANEPSESRLAALLGFDLGWNISPRVSFSQGASAVAQGSGQGLVIADTSNTSINLSSALNAKISDRLSNRISYELNYNSNPPSGVVKSSTISRFSLVYGF